MAEEAKQSAQSIDPCSFANIHEIKSTNTNINLVVHFDKKILSGNVDLSFKCIANEVKTIILDTNQLDITSVYTTDNDKKTQLKYSYLDGNDKVPTFGKPLRIELTSALKSDDVVTVSIEYSTSPTAQAIQWLTPEQTHGKKLPYLFTQCQAIGARTLLVCLQTCFVYIYKLCNPYPAMSRFTSREVCILCKYYCQ